MIDAPALTNERAMALAGRSMLVRQIALAQRAGAWALFATGLTHEAQRTERLRRYLLRHDLGSALFSERETFRQAFERLIGERL